MSDVHNGKESVVMTTADIGKFSLRKANTTARNSARNMDKKSGILIEDDQSRAGAKNANSGFFFIM